MKDKSFARAINRDDIILGTEELCIEIRQYIQNIIEGMKLIAHTLGINGTSQRNRLAFQAGTIVAFTQRISIAACVAS